jgi:ABC-type branched-subunit amino acid transport system substrate-binding protein
MTGPLTWKYCALIPNSLTGSDIHLHRQRFPDSRRALGGLRIMLVLGFASLVAACGSLGFGEKPVSPPSTIVQSPPVKMQPKPAAQGVVRDPANFYTPKQMEGRPLIRVAILLPFNAPNSNIRALSSSLYNAAQLALFEFNNPNILLMPKATGSAAAAHQAAEDAIREGADLILGPLFAEEVTAIAPVARASGVPVVAFSSDITVAGNGVYLLSFPPDEDVSRIVDYAVLNGMTRFAALTPQNDYGNRVAAAFRKAVTDHGATLTDIASYPTATEGMNDPVKQVAHYSARHAALVAHRSALQKAGDAAGAKALEKVDTMGDLPYQAIFLPEGGQRLRALAPLLPYYDIDPRKIKFLGTGLWDDRSLAREGALEGGWFPAPPPEAHERFVARYARAYHATPPRIASLAYDGVSLAVALSAQPAETRFTEAALTHPDGFAGVDGIFRFLPDGRTERGLAILEMHSSGPVVIDPAPVSFSVPPIN